MSQRARSSAGQAADSQYQLNIKRSHPVRPLAVPEIEVFSLLKSPSTPKHTTNKKSHS
jgi:hypothetical protein